jgi:acyl carrier protein
MGSPQQAVPASEDIRSAVRQFIVTNFLFGADSVKLKSETSFLESGVIDSTGILELIRFIEATYAIQVEDNEMVPECLDSLDNVARFVVRKMTASRARPQ